jgi:hypothetical protein
MVSVVSTPLTFRVSDSSTPNQITTKNLTLTIAVVAGGTIAMPNVALGQNLQTAIAVTLNPPAPAGGVVMSISSSNPAAVKLSPRPDDPGVSPHAVTITEGTGQFLVYVQGFAASGSATLTASAAGYASGTATVSLTPSAFVLEGPNGIGASITSNQGEVTPITVRAARLDASLNYVQTQQVRGSMNVNVPLTNSNPAAGSAPSIASFTGGTDTVPVQFAATTTTTGTTTITATPPAGFSLPAASANAVVITVLPAGIMTSSVTVGYKLQTTGQATLQGVAPAGGLIVTLTSNEAGKVLLSKTPDGAGAASITMTVPAGFSATQDFYIHGIASSGTATYTASAPGFGSANGTVTLTPSGFVLSGPFGLGANFLTTAGSANSNINVFAARLDASGNYMESQALAGGLSANISVTSSAPAAGTITTSPVTITGGTNLAITQFDPVSAGSTTLTATGPADFSIPAQHRTLSATVLVPNLVLEEGLMIGKSLQQISSVLVGDVAGPGGLEVTLTSNDPGLLKLAATGTVAGTDSIIVTIPEGQTTTTFYVQSLGDFGTATFTATAPGYPSRTATVTLAPSGIVIGGMFGLGLPHWPSVATGPSQMTVYTALLNPGNNNFLQFQELAGGTSQNVSLTNSDPSVGTVQTPVTISGGTDRVITLFTPLLANMTTLVSVAKPSNFSLPSQHTSVVVQVFP